MKIISALKKIDLIFLFLVPVVMLCFCKKEETNTPDNPPDDDTTIVEQAQKYIAVDISQLPVIESEGTIFYNQEGIEQSFLDILLEHGINTIRLKLWHRNGTAYDLQSVSEFANRIKSQGFKLWVTIHYSDTWADPGNQQKPSLWNNISYDVLKDSAYNYTSKVVFVLNPDIVQIGNEIDGGFLFPDGDRYENPMKFKELLKQCSNAVRNSNPDCKIMIHIAQHNYSTSYYSFIQDVDYDQIGFSYYPIWHGKNLHALKDTMQKISMRFNKEILIAETSYPFTLGWNDWTNNIVGLESHLIPNYPATEEGQANYVRAIHNMMNEIDKGSGFCYWGAEMVAWRGVNATNGSTWENQALFDFTNQALPVFESFLESN